MSPNSDFKDLLSIFNAEGVRYLIVGGYAVMKYAEPRFTKDLDVWVDAAPDNAARVFQALSRFGAPLSGLKQNDFADEQNVFQVGVPPSRIDIVMGVEGVAFIDAWPNRVEGMFEGAHAWFISKTDLILTKEACGRPQDRIDVDLLRATGLPPEEAT